MLKKYILLLFMFLNTVYGFDYNIKAQNHTSVETVGFYSWDFYDSDFKTIISDKIIELPKELETVTFDSNSIYKFKADTTDSLVNDFLLPAKKSFKLLFNQDKNLPFLKIFIVIPSIDDNEIHRYSFDIDSSKLSNLVLFNILLEDNKVKIFSSFNNKETIYEPSFHKTISIDDLKK